MKARRDLKVNQVEGVIEDIMNDTMDGDVTIQGYEKVKRR